VNVEYRSSAQVRNYCDFNGAIPDVQQVLFVFWGEVSLWC
jgi:hypothetical protein